MIPDSNGFQGVMRSFVLMLVAAWLAACGTDESSRAAPIGDRKALERLEVSYNRLAEKLSTNPLNMSMKDRKNFVQAVFHDSGFDYRATLDAMAQARVKPDQPYVKDMADLLMLPHRSTGTSERIEDIYNDEELADVKAIQAKFP